MANPVIDWRIVFAVGATLAFIVLVIRSHASETMRMLAAKGHVAEAENLVKEME